MINTMSGTGDSMPMLEAQRVGVFLGGGCRVGFVGAGDCLREQLSLNHRPAQSYLTKTSVGLLDFTKT
jgi:hypothetical protein